MAASQNTKHILPQNHMTTLTGWLDREDSIGVFVNHDLGSHNCGHTIYLPIAPNERSQCVVGRTRAPDNSYDLGWRYILESIEDSLENFEFVS